MKKNKEWLTGQIKTQDIIMDKGCIYTEDIMRIINQLEEPELPAIPQFVANFIKGRTVSECFYYSYIMPNECNQETYEWINDNQTETARAILDGYTIEPEQPKTRQVLVKFFDNEEYKTELTEESARELIEFLEANKK